MLDIRLKELDYIIKSTHQAGDLTTLGLKNINGYLDYVKQRFDKLVIDVNETKRDLKEQIEYLNGDIINLKGQLKSK